jgi:hypothetical protein
LTYIGSGHGDLPGQFKTLVGVAIDKKNRVFTAEQEPGRVQMFRYVTDAEAAAEKKRQDEELQKKSDQRRNAAAPAQTGKPAEAPAQKAPDSAPAAPAPSPTAPAPLPSAPSPPPGH